MAVRKDYFEKCKTTLEVHIELRTLLIYDFLKVEKVEGRFISKCKFDISPAENSSIEDIIGHLERTGQFSEGNYDFIKRKVENIDAETIELIKDAEKRIRLIRERSLLVLTHATDVEEKTRKEVDDILLAVYEKLLCRSVESDEDVSGLWDRYQDLDSLSNKFLDIWHKEFCRCRKEFGKELLLKNVRSGAQQLEKGEEKFDIFKNKTVPILLAILTKSANTALHMYKECGATLVSVKQSSVLSYWIFDSIINLDKLWRKYKEKGLHDGLQECFNTEEALSLFNVNRISLRITIQESDYLKYRQILVQSTLLTMKEMLYERNNLLLRTPQIHSYLIQSPDTQDSETSEKLIEKTLFLPLSLREYQEPVLLLRQSRATAARTHDFLRFPEDSCSCVFILGEAGCGKTTYCLRLLHQWCEAQQMKKEEVAELGQFNYVFYVTSLVLPKSNDSLLDLIMNSTFGKQDLYQQEAVSVLKDSTEKCLILIDDAQNLQKYLNCDIEEEFSELENKFPNCVFVLTMQPTNLLRTFSPDTLHKMNIRVLHLTGVDESAKSSLYVDQMIQFSKSGDSGGLIHRQEAATRLETLTESEQRIHESDPDGRMKESILVQKTQESNSKQKIYGSYLEQKMHEAEAKESHKTMESEQNYPLQTSIQLDPEYEEGKFQPQVILRQIKEMKENYEAIMRTPILGVTCVLMLIEEKPVSMNRTGLYLSLIDELISRHEMSLPDEEAVPFGTEQLDRLQSYKSIQRHLIALRDLGNLAHHCLLDHETYHDRLEKYLDEDTLTFATKSCLLFVHKTSTMEDASVLQNFHFLHAVIRDCLAAIYVTSDKDTFKLFCSKLNSFDIISDLSNVIMIICGISQYFGCRLSSRIKEVIDKEEKFIGYRNDQPIYVDPSIREFYKQQLSWYNEFSSGMAETGAKTNLDYHVTDIYIDDESDDDVLDGTVKLLSDRKVKAMSLHLEYAQAEGGVSDQVVNDFLAYNSSLVSLFIRGSNIKRSIDSLSIPTLKSLYLADVQIKHTNDDDAPPLFMNLPKIQKLRLCRVGLNNRLLGLTADEGKMPLLKSLDMSIVNMGNQPIELAKDMKTLENINLYEVKMTDQGWMAFAKSIVIIPHPFQVLLNQTDIDAKLKKMIRSDPIFAVESVSGASFAFTKRTFAQYIRICARLGLTMERMT